MKSENNTGNSRNGTGTKNSTEKDAYANIIEVGSVGIEGGTDSGASTLRVLKRKHANDAPVKSAKRPIL